MVEYFSFRSLHFPSQLQGSSGCRSFSYFTFPTYPLQVHATHTSSSAVAALFIAHCCSVFTFPSPSCSWRLRRRDILRSLCHFLMVVSLSLVSVYVFWLVLLFFALFFSFFVGIVVYFFVRSFIRCSRSLFSGSPFVQLVSVSQHSHPHFSSSRSCSAQRTSYHPVPSLSSLSYRCYNLSSLSSRFHLTRFSSLPVPSSSLRHFTL